MPLKCDVLMIFDYIHKHDTDPFKIAIHNHEWGKMTYSENQI